MMKIKEMTKLYKKITKAKEMYSDSELVVRYSTLDDMTDFMIGHINNMRKAANTVKKIADCLCVTVDSLTSNIETEEKFCFWCMMNGIEIKTAITEEAEEPEE